MSQVEEQNTEPDGAKGSNPELCYDVGGLIIRPVSRDAIITRDIENAFSLSRCYTVDFDITLEGFIRLDNDYFQNMPAFVRGRVDGIDKQSPWCFKGPDGQIVVLARGKETSSYTISSPPYDLIQLNCQKLSEKAAPLLYQTVLLPMISELLVKRGRLLMHAGCVATPEGDGILLIADSGGGKTTTTFSMANHGFRFISDDLVVASGKPGGLVFEPVREKMNLTRQTIDFFPQTAYLRELLLNSPERKLPVAPADVFSTDGITDQGRAVAIFILKIGPKGPRLTQLATDAILKPMLKQSNFARGEALSRERIDLLWRLLDQTQCYQLETGLSPDDLGGWLKKKAIAGTFCPSSTLLEQIDRENRTKFSFTQVRKGRARTRAWSPQSLQIFIKSLLSYTLENRLEHAGFINHFYAKVNQIRFWRWLTYHRIENHAATYARAQLIPMDQRGDTADGLLMKAQAHALQLAAVAARVIRHLASQEIPSLLQRGPAMAKVFFPEPFLRYCRDVDVIVPSKDLEKAEYALRELGFQTREDRSYWLRKGEIPMTDGRVVVELHWQVYPVLAPMPKAESTVWEETRSIELEGTTVNMPAPEQLLLSSCIHLACEHWMDRMVRLIDIRQILHHTGSDFDWDWLLAKTLEGGMRLPVGHVLSTAQNLVEAPVPQHVLKRLAAVSFAEKVGYNLIGSRRFLMQPGSIGSWRRSLYRRLIRHQSHHDMPF